MDNKEAIKELSEWLDGCCGGEEIEPTRQALRLAISALQAQDSPKPIAESVQNVKNEDLISRKEAIDAIEKNAYRHTYLDQIIDIVSELPSAQPEPQWIPVSERLPEPRVDVWVNSDIGQIQGYYEEHIGIWYASFGQGRDYLELIVTAWMPLPEPYRAERRTDGDGRD